MPGEILSLDPSKIATLVLIDDDLIIRRLAGVELARWMHCS